MYLGTGCDIVVLVWKFCFINIVCHNIDMAIGMTMV